MTEKLYTKILHLQIGVKILEIEKYHGVLSVGFPVKATVSHDPVN